MRSTINVLRRLPKKEYLRLLERVKNVRDSYFSPFRADTTGENFCSDTSLYPSSTALGRAEICVAYCALRDRLFDREVLHRVLTEHHFLE